MFNMIIRGIVFVFGGALLFSVYQNKLFSQINCEMTNRDIDINKITFSPRNIIVEK